MSYMSTICINTTMFKCYLTTKHLMKITPRNFGDIVSLKLSRVASGTFQLSSGVPFTGNLAESLHALFKSIGLTVTSCLLICKAYYSQQSSTQRLFGSKGKYGHRFGNTPALLIFIHFPTPPIINAQCTDLQALPMT